MKLSVIICTFNPRPEFLRRVLNALKAQTLPLNEWELLLMDNASKEPVAEKFDLSWHPNGRHIREENAGKTYALLTAIRESTGELLMTVDDDNVLKFDYLEKAVGISKEFPSLGAWAGNIEGEFEIPVPDWLKPHLHKLAVRTVDRDYWANFYADNRSMPFGAGLCFRRCVALDYSRALVERPDSKDLDPKGNTLMRGGDIDLVMTAYDTGFGAGMFCRLQLTHIIPKGRMTIEYVCRLLEGIEYSTHLLFNQRDAAYVPPRETSALKKYLRAFQVWRLPEPLKSLVQAENRGLAKATAEIATKSRAN